MIEKFNYYDAIAHLIPGTIGCLFCLYAFDLLGISIPRPEVGSLGGLGIGVAIAYTFGHLLQSLASTLEPSYYAVWGGKPSVKLLQDKSECFSEAQRNRMVADLVSFFKVNEKCPDDSQGMANFYQRLFERCMTLCNRNRLGRVEAFNAIYGFHRVLLTTFGIGFITYATIWIKHHYLNLALSPSKNSLLIALLILTGAGTAIEAFRARKRAYYYAKEVLWMASDYIGASVEISD